MIYATKCLHLFFLLSCYLMELLFQNIWLYCTVMQHETLGKQTIGILQQICNTFIHIPTASKL